MAGSDALTRRLTRRDAVVLGLGSMLGAGVFSVFAPAASAAGGGLVVGLALAAAVAYLNATSSAQLAAQYPTSGGTYVYGRARLGQWPGFLAGWSFVVGKTASCSAMALTFASYAVQPDLAKPVAVTAVIGLGALNYLGVSRTAGVARVIVALVLLVLGVVIASGAAGSGPGIPRSDAFGQGWYGVLQSAGLLFFAFAGYARIATMGEEVKDPRRTIPWAIMTALSIALVVYALVAVTVLGALGPQRLATSGAPLMDTVLAAGWGWAAPVVRLGAAAASLGALLALMAGVGRTILAMARNNDLPAWLGGVHPKHRVPHHAEIAITVAVSALVLAVDLRGAIGFSSFGVLLYYAIANASALTQRHPHRRYPKVLQLAGIAGCLLLVVTLPGQSIAAGIAVLLIGIGYRIVRQNTTSDVRIGSDDPDRHPRRGSGARLILDGLADHQQAHPEDQDGEPRAHGPRG